MGMKRIDQEPTTENIIESLKTNYVGRNQDVKGFLKTLDLIEGGFSFFLDGPWGDGKTFFVKEASAVMRLANGQIQNPEGITGLSELGEHFARFQLERGYMPVYYNAWCNDSDDDPVLSLMKVLVTEHKQLTDLAEISKSTSEKITKIADGVLGLTSLATSAATLAFTGVPMALPNGSGISGIVESFKKQCYFDSLQTDEEIRDVLKNMLEELMEGKADRLVLFIDELDRCRPAFALKVLERVKFLFNLDNVIVVFSTDLDKLSAVVENFYGQEFDGRRYLARFYDQVVKLSPVDIGDYARKKGFDKRSLADEIVRHLISSKSITMRDLHRVHQTIEPIKQRQPSVFSESDSIWILAIGVFVPFLAFVRILEPELYEKVQEGRFETMWERMASCSEFENATSSAADLLRRQIAPNNDDPEIVPPELRDSFEILFLIILFPESECAKEFIEISSMEPFAYRQVVEDALSGLRL